ncbi:hypothetical protein [Christiangramia crocea]|uniref:Uncharacterized protein n=1 Tax=Christiangramia crocea TaxID=2904124 RepID=A0A9X2A6Y7_9FLAO|nr:hypothetical protein [Gramella crocea]MCG9971012.1 hypothetical protein [Gramella crocea]
MEKYNYDYAVGKPSANIQVINEGTEYEHRIGNYIFEKGEVHIYADPKIITFSMLFKGRHYNQTVSDFKKEFTDLGLKRMAGKFGRRTLEKVLIWDKKIKD